jgi:hypothetical protein
LVKKLVVRDLSQKIELQRLETVCLAHEIRMNVELATIGKVLEKNIKAFTAVKVLELVISG